MMEEGALSPEMHQTLEAGKGEEMDSLLESPVEACQHLDLNSVKPISSFWPSEVKVNKVCYFKPQSL